MCSTDLSRTIYLCTRSHCKHEVVCQAQGTQQSLVTAKLHLAKQGLTIPRQELVSTHMTVNLISNVKEALTGFPVKGV